MGVEMPSAGLRMRGRRRAAGGLILVMLLATVAAGSWFVLHERHAAVRRTLAGLPRATVHRGDMVITLSTPGWVDSEEKTPIECELENLAVSSSGGQMMAGGSATILD